MKLPRVEARQAERALKALGFQAVRQSGSHRIYRNAAGRRATVPIHDGKALHPKVLLSIIADSGVPRDEFLRLL